MGIKTKLQGLKLKVIMNFITRFLATFIDKLKVNNPTVFLVIQVVVGFLIYSADSCIEWLEFCGTEAFGTWAKEIKAMLIALGLGLGSRTSRYVEKGK